MKTDLIVQVGPRVDTVVKIPVRISTGGHEMVYAAKGVPGWFSDAQVVARRTREGWRSVCGYDLKVLHENVGCAFVPVRNGDIRRAQ